MIKTVVVKFLCGDDIRRVTLPHNTTFPELISLLTQLFNIKDITIKYVDEEGDKITVSTNEELTEAFGISESLQPPILRIFVFGTTQTDQLQLPTTISQPQILPILSEQSSVSSTSSSRDPPSVLSRKTKEDMLSISSSVANQISSLSSQTAQRNKDLSIGSLEPLHEQTRKMTEMGATASVISGNKNSEIASVLTKTQSDAIVGRTNENSIHIASILSSSPNQVMLAVDQAATDISNKTVELTKASLKSIDEAIRNLTRPC
jgi:hypothetical protein